jgi:4-hydroxybenzoate polyprenyltransferase
VGIDVGAGQPLMARPWSKSLNRLHPRAWDFVQLARVDKPIGIYLLLWPTLWAVWIAGAGKPSMANIAIFVLGVVLMRGAGCVINDVADRKVDGHVKRTEQRPLVSGRISTREALVFFAVLVGLSFVLVLFTNLATIGLSVGGLVLAASYPFMKRYTHLPQVVLGAAFSWGMPMAFTAQTGHLPAAAWLLYAANLLWTVAYDTYYAMVDRDDDLRIGIKSTAVLFGHNDRLIIAILQGLAVVCLLLAGLQFGLGAWFHLGLAGAIGCFVWEYWHTRERERNACFRAFLHNHWAGLLIFLGIALDYGVR